MHPLALGLQKAGDDVTVLTPYHPELDTSRFPYRIISYAYIWPKQFHVLGYSQTLHHGMRLGISSYILAPFMIISGILALLHLTKKDGFDMVSAHWIIPNGIIAAVVCAIRRIPFCVTLPGSDVYIAQKNRLFSAVTRWASQRAAFICADSPQYITELKKTGARVPNRKIIPYPVDVAAIQTKKGVSDIRRKLGIAPDAGILVSVGRLIEKKGFQYAIRGLPAILQKYPKTVYVIVGSGDMEAELKKEAEISGVSASVLFVGNVLRRQISAYYSLADVVLVPSVQDHEGNIDDRPVALLEAMACGRAVVVSRLPGNAMTIEHGKSGLLIPQKNPNAIARATITVLRSRSLRLRLGREAKKSVEEKFRHTVIGRQYHNIFQDIVLGRHG